MRFFLSHHHALGLALLGAATLGACTSGSRNESEDGDDGASAAADTFHLIRDTFLHLSVIDPLDPGRVIEVDNQHNTLDFVVGGKVAPGEAGIQDLRLDSVVYANALQNTIYRIPMQIERVAGVAQPPDVAPLATMVADVVELWVASDLSGDELLNTVVFETGLGFEVFQHVGTNATVTVPFPGRPVAELKDPVSAELLGWLALTGSELVVTDPMGASESVLIAATQASVVGTTADGAIYMTVDGRLCSYQLSGEFNELLVPFPSASSLAVVIGEELFYADEAPLASFRVNRTDVDGPTATIASLPRTLGSLGATPSRLLALRQDASSGDDELLSMNLDGSQQLTLDDGVGTIEMLATRYSDETVFYNTPSEARAVQSDGSGLIWRPNSSWLAPNLVNELPPPTARPFTAMFLADESDGPIAIDVVSPATPAAAGMRLGNAAL